MFKILLRCMLMLASLIVINKLTAQEELTAKTLGSWTAIDGVPVADVGAGTITLPAGTQLYRTLPDTPIQLHLVSRPVFNAIPADWATLEVGPASLTFVRDANGGGMVLLADEPLALPFALPLDEKNRAKIPLALTLTYDPMEGIAVLTIEGVDFDIGAKAPSGPIDVAMSAGKSADWTLDKVELLSGKKAAPLLGSPKPETRPAGGHDMEDEVSPPYKGNRAEVRTQALDRSKGLFVTGDDAVAEKALTDANTNPKNSAEWHLESANELTQMAFSLARSGHSKKAAQIAQRALEHADKAQRKAARQADQVSLVTAAEELAALIQMRLLADYKEARIMYEKAAMRYPRGQVGRELERMDQIEERSRLQLEAAVKAKGEQS